MSVVGQALQLQVLILCTGRAFLLGNSDQTVICAKGMFKCVDDYVYRRGRCLLESAKCNGDRDCPRGEDEDDCTSCTGGSVFCVDEKNGANICGSRCDGVVECRGGIDEAGCPHCRGCGTIVCGYEQLVKNGTTKFLGVDGTVPAPHPVTCGRLCDGVVQCPDGEDETYCESDSSRRAVVYPGFRCEDENKCARKCDHRSECRRGEDENGCAIYGNLRPSSLFEN